MKSIICGILLAILIITSSIFFVAYDKKFYNSEFLKYNVKENTNLSEDELNYTISWVISYLSDKDYNTNFGLFNEQEKLHMQDVKSIFIALNFISIFIFIILLSYFLFMVLKKDYSNLGKCFVIASFAVVSILLFVFLSFSISFDSSFLIFHKLFFKGNYAFSAEENLIVNIFPEKLFYDALIKIVMYTTLFSAIIFLLGIFLKNPKFNYIPARTK